MKKIYFLAFAIAGMAFSANAQLINDNMEGYPQGPVHEGHWSTWSGNAGFEDLIISGNYANSGTQSGMIGANLGDELEQDAFLLLGNEDEGEFTVSWHNYVPSGKSGYYNFQENEVPGSGAWAINVYYFHPNAEAGTAWIVDDANPGNVVAVFSYPEDAWFKITHEIDLDGDTVIMYMDGNEVYNGPFYSGGNLGGADFYSTAANTEFYIDDVVYAEGFLSVSNFTADSFSVYPNPVSDVLNINSKVAVDNVIVYDILGKVVLQVAPGMISPTIDMSSLSAGTYLVKVTIDNTSKTVKILK